jgi:hypothetical protein
MCVVAAGAHRVGCGAKKIASSQRLQSAWARMVRIRPDMSEACVSRASSPHRRVR